MRPVCLLLMALLTLAAPPSTPAEAERSVGVRLELSQKFYYVGDPLWVRITVRNAGEDEIANPLKTRLTAGFEVETVSGGRSGGKVTAPAKPAVTEPARPEKLAPRSFYGAVVDLGRLYPGVAEAGTYRIHWSGDGILSERLTVRVIPKYDPAKRYTANVETSAGTIQIGFFPESAPIAVKAFIDMAHAGFYDGLLFQEIQADAFIAGGNPSFGEQRERHPFTYPAEQNRLPLVSGTVIVKPVGASPPTNGPEFMVLLKPQPAWSGQVTVIGQVLKGFDVAQGISRQPSTDQKERPFFKPLQNIMIRRVEVTEVPVSVPEGP